MVTLVDYDRALLAWLTLRDEEGNQRTYGKGTVVRQMASADVFADVAPPRVLLSGALPETIIVDIPSSSQIARGMGPAAFYGSYEYRGK